jgi:hypothetical protein
VVLDPDSLDVVATMRVLDGRIHALVRSREKQDAMLIGGSRGLKVRFELSGS